MKKLQSNGWVSYYLYYEADPDALLTIRVWPFVKRLTEKQLISQFFFIRYTDSRGPHIRLRLLPFSAHTRQAVMRHGRKVFPDAKFAAYIPETERYGGSVGLPIAERLFQASSAAVLQLLAQDGTWSYRRALASGLQMHIGMLQALALSRAETVALCKHIAEIESEKSVELLEQGFAAQRDVIVPQLTAVWAACEKKVDFKDDWFTDWRQAAAQISVEIHQANKLRKFELVDSTHHASQLWCLYESYIHMTNNRLGIMRRDEAFVAYLLQRSLG
jgi:thiopeptide-type bacteriocin biosynthesis protein